MNEQLFERLLNEEESTSLDFKEAQYLLGDDDVLKSELVKDIVAFANSWRRTEAYILIGVREVKGGRSQVLGVAHHLNDNDIQQLVTSKTQRPVEFAYEAFTFEGKPVGVLRIPRQQRPLYLKARFGKLNKEVVYVRRGSATVEASPDEVSRMGAADLAEKLEAEQPTLEVQFCDPDQHTELGRQITFTCEALQVPADKDIPDYGSGGGWAAALNSYMRNRDFYRQVAKYVWANALFRPLAFVVGNLASVTAADVQVRVTIPGASGITVLTQGRYPHRPDPSSFLHGLGLHNAMKPPPVKIEPYGEDMIVTTHLGKLQPKGRAWSAEPFFIGTTKSQKLALESEVSADTLRDPLRTSFEVEVQVSSRVMTLDQLFQLAEKYQHHS